MPVFKITEKRLKKRQRQEEDAEMLEQALKELQEASDEGEGEEGEEDEDGEDDEDEDESDLESIGTMDSEDDSSDEDGSEASEGGQDEDEEEEEEDGEDDQVSANPTYLLPSPPHPTDSSACVVCPTRIFKNEHMIKEHLNSKIHKRSMKRWESYLSTAASEGRELEGDPRLIVEEIMDDLEVTREGGEDEKEKKKTRGRKRTTKAQRQDEKAKKLLEAVQAGSTDSPAKKQKTEGSDEKSGEVKLNRKARRMAQKQGIKV